MNVLTYTDPQQVRHPVELVRRHDTPRFYVVRSQLTNQVLHVDAAALVLNGRHATPAQLDELLTPSPRPSPPMGAREKLEAP